jgi:hypothetical protein
MPATPYLNLEITLMRCPNCYSDVVDRSHRRNALERIVSIARIFPFRCAKCASRFFRFHRSD